MIKIGIDPSGTGTTAIVAFKNNELIYINEYSNKFWINHTNEIIKAINKLYTYEDITLNIENCYFTSAGGSKDRDDLLRLLGSIEKEFYDIINWVTPKYTKTASKNMEFESKYEIEYFKKIGKENKKLGGLIEYMKEPLLTYQRGTGWKYNNEKISNHLRDAIIIANYESK